MAETFDGFVTRAEAELLWMPPPWKLRACDQTVRYYLSQFAIQAHERGWYSRIDLLRIASSYEGRLAVAREVSSINITTNVTTDQGEING